MTKNYTAYVLYLSFLAAVFSMLIPERIYFKFESITRLFFTIAIHKRSELILQSVAIGGRQL